MPDKRDDSITAVQMAKDAGVDRRAFRRALRKAKLAWWQKVTGWKWRVPPNSPEHDDMKRVLADMLRK